MASFLDFLGGANPWTAVIGAGLQLYGANKASDAATSSADKFNQTVTEAAKPKNVVGPAGGVVWDEATQTFVIAPSNPLMGLMGANLEDVYRQRSLIEDYMVDPEAAARARFDKMTEAMMPYRERKGQGLLGQLIKSGTAGSTMGIAAVEEDELSNRLYDATRLEADRANVQSDITNYINRSNSAATNYLGLMSPTTDYTNISTGLANNAFSAANVGGTGLMNAYTQAGSDKAQFPYQLGTQMLGYRPDTSREDLEAQYNYAGGWYPGAN